MTTQPATSGSLLASHTVQLCSYSILVGINLCISLILWWRYITSELPGHISLLLLPSHQMLHTKMAVLPTTKEVDANKKVQRNTAWKSINCPSSLLSVNFKARMGLEEYGCYPFPDFLHNKIYAHATLRSLGVGCGLLRDFSELLPTRHLHCNKLHNSNPDFLLWLYF